MPKAMPIRLAEPRGGPGAPTLDPPLDDAAWVQDTLVALGIVQSTQLVHDEVFVIDATRRNRNWIVNINRRPVAVVCSRTHATADAFRAEVDLHGQLASSDHLAQHVPPLLASDAEQRLLAFTHVGSAIDGWALHAQEMEPPLRFATQFGALLAAVHSNSESFSGVLGAATPWVLSIHRPPLEMTRSLSTASFELLRQIQSDLTLCHALDMAADSWRSTSLIHGDVTWANVLVTGNCSELHLVDWELAQRGDPLWDVAGMLGAYLVFWVHARRSPPAPGHSLAGLRLAAGLAWQRYCALVRPDVLQDATVEKLAALVAARMLRSAYETTQALDRFSQHAVHLLFLASRLAEDPHGAAHDLMNVEASDLR